MYGPGIAPARRSLSVSVLHYANLSALIAVAVVFVTFFLYLGMIQLVGDDYYDAYYGGYYDDGYYDDGYDDEYDHSLWDELGMGEILGYLTETIVSFSFAFLAALICAGASWKMRKEGASLLLLIVALVSALVGAAALHSYASLVFLAPTAAALYALMEMLIRNGLAGVPVGMNAGRSPQRWYPGEPYQARQPYPQDDVYAGQAYYPPDQGAAAVREQRSPDAGRASQSAAAFPAGFPGRGVPQSPCPKCGGLNPPDALFCGSCGTKLS
jgi:hypothetical protein